MTDLEQFDYAVLGVGLFIFIVLGVCSTSGIRGFIVCIEFAKVLTIISLNTISAPPHHLQPSEHPITCTLN